jgi:TonB family protein
LESPNYPPLARQTRIQGKITVSALVYKDGTISVAKEGKGHPLLLGAAQDNLKTWRFEPNDSSEPIPIDVEYEFVLDTEHLSGGNAASAVTLDLPRHVRVVAPGPVPIIDYAPVMKKHWWQFWK